MEKSLGQISILVKDYDEALSFYISILGFELVEDTQLNSEKRWVVIKPRNSNGQGCNLLLAKASNAHQEYFIGNQSGGDRFNGIIGILALELRQQNLRWNIQLLMKEFC
jgi:catechol 2,3-dioxygenase-like lactoylglutathione lyase family enzyme